MIIKNKKQMPKREPNSTFLNYFTALKLTVT